MAKKGDMFLSLREGSVRIDRIVHAPYPLRSVSVGWPDATLMLITGQCPQGMRLDYKSFIRSRVEPGGLGTMHCRQWVSLLLTSAFG